MLAGRRCIVLPLAFLGLAVLLCSASAAFAQQGSNPSHNLWTNNLTAEQIKARLGQLGTGVEGDEDQLHKMIREQLVKKYPNVPQESLDALIKKTLADPRFMEMAKQMAREKQT